jgi:hypothetical protein
VAPRLSTLAEPFSPGPAKHSPGASSGLDPESHIRFAEHEGHALREIHAEAPRKACRPSARAARRRGELRSGTWDAMGEA